MLLHNLILYYCEFIYFLFVFVPKFQKLELQVLFDLSTVVSFAAVLIVY
jgi:hypothetical protein